MQTDADADADRHAGCRQTVQTIVELSFTSATVTPYGRGCVEDLKCLAQLKWCLLVYTGVVNKTKI